MKKKQYSRYNSKGSQDRINSSKGFNSRQNLKKTPQSTQSQREKSAKPNQLPQILKDYKQFCEKYFNSNTNPNSNQMHNSNNGIGNSSGNGNGIGNGNVQSTQSLLTPPINFPSFSYSNQIIPDSDTQTPSQVKFSFIDETDYGILNSLNTNNDLMTKIKFQLDKQSIGFEKNNKLDYEQRINRVIKKKKNERTDEEGNEEKYEEEEFNFKDELEVDKKEKDKSKYKENSNKDEGGEDKSNENDKNIIDNDSNDKDKDKEQNNKINGDTNSNPIKIFDESTHNIINEEIRNQNATKIQMHYKTQYNTHYHNLQHKHKRLFFGYDKSKRNIVSIFIKQRSLPVTNDKQFTIYSLLFKVYSLETHVLTYEPKEIKDLISENSITNVELSKRIPDLIEKVVKSKKDDKDDKEDNDSEYDFEEISNNKAIPKDIHQSISSIDQCDYDNI